MTLNDDVKIGARVKLQLRFQQSAWRCTVHINNDNLLRFLPQDSCIMNIQHGAVFNPKYGDYQSIVREDNQEGGVLPKSQ